MGLIQRKKSGNIMTGSRLIVEGQPMLSAKVFEVNILINESDPILRPSMTSGNIIITKTLKNVVHIPLSCVQAEGDKTFVYLKDKKKQEVMLGDSDESNIIVTKGILWYDVSNTNIHFPFTLCVTAFYTSGFPTLRAILFPFPFARMQKTIDYFFGAPEVGSNDHIRRFLSSGGNIEEYIQRYA
jgi:hypothetical protein